MCISPSCLFCPFISVCFSHFLGLIYRLQKKLAPHGVRLSIPGLQALSDEALLNGEPSEPSLVRLLTLLCGLELNGNLHSELEQVVEKERACLLKDGLLQGLLKDSALRHCLDVTVENCTPGKIKVLEVTLKKAASLNG